jgi:stage II sporulation protein D
VRARALAALALAGALVSCARVPVPAPTPAPTPVPSPSPVPPAPRPAPPAPGPLTLAGEPMIEVGLAWDLDSLTLAPATRAGLTAQRFDGPGRNASPLASEPPNGPVTLRRTATGASSVPASAAFNLLRGDTLWVAAPSGDMRFAWNGHVWRGQAKVFVNARGTLTLVSRLPLENYLLGVVPGEIGGLGEDLLEAGRAQAVAARSYTLFYRGRRAAEGFDVFATVEDQVYGALDSERPLATRCVESTRGEVALSGGQPIRANYCSTCGGVTAEVWEAWPAAALPYLVSHPDRGAGDFCAASPLYRWREEWTADEFVRTVERWAPAQGVRLPAGGLGTLLDVRVDARSRSGRVWRLVVSGSRGEVVVPAYSARQVLRRPGNGNAILRSNLFKIAVRRDPATRRTLSVVASGAGSGHGVGLCQTGALGMARAGRGYREIVEHYYRGVALERLYGAAAGGSGAH